MKTPWTAARERKAIAASKIVAFARDQLKLQLTDGQQRALALFEAGHYSQAVWCWGRRGGKSLMAAVLSLYDVALRDQLRQFLRVGEVRYAAVVCPRLHQANQHLATCRSLVRRSPLLSRLLVSEAADQLVFSNGAAVLALPCSARGIRGLPFSSLVLDEIGHFFSNEDGNSADARVLEAVQPALAQFGALGWMVSISTPRWKQGSFYELCERARSNRHPSMMYVHYTSLEANGTLDKKWLKELQRQDPDLFAREYEARFVDGVSSYLSSADVSACVRSGTDKLYPQPSIAYVAALDPAFSLDRFAMAIAHEDALGRVIIDGVWTWHRRGYVTTLEEVAQLCRAYHVQRLRTDQYAAPPIIEGLAQRRIQCDYVPWSHENKSAAFGSLKVGLNTRAIELPDDNELVNELCALAASPTPSGLTRISAPSGGFDDRAVAVAGVVASFGESGQAIPAEMMIAAGPSYGWDPSAGALRQSLPPPRPAQMTVSPTDPSAVRLTPGNREVIASSTGELLLRGPQDPGDVPITSNWPTLGLPARRNPFRADLDEPCLECNAPPGKMHEADCASVYRRYGIDLNDPGNW
jgi:hypothetical protein